MPEINRRTFLTVSGAALGGIAAGTTATAAAYADRFIIQTRGSRLPSGVEVVHELPGIKFAVVEGSEKRLQQSKVVKDYAADTRLALDAPEVEEFEKFADKEDVYDVRESRNEEDLYELEWDKQVQDIKTAHETTKGEGTRVAVIDDGVFADHPDLDVNVGLSRNFTLDTNGTGALFDDHGTHVAGTIGAKDNDTGVLGTAPETELVDLRVFSGTGASFGSIVAAIVYAARIDCDVANLSLGAYPIPRQGLGSFYGKVLNSSMTFVNKEGTLLVIAAGNDSADLQNDKNLISLPNEGAQGVSVASTGPEGFSLPPEGLSAPEESPAYYTNYGTNAITVAAPGGNLDLTALAEFNASEPGLTLPELQALIGDWVLSTTFDAEGSPETKDIDGDGEADIVTNTPDEQIPRYGYKQGTSMAAPQVAGAAALVKANNPDYSPNQVEAALKRAASVPEGYDKSYYGSGFVNVVDAL